jgi:hypothetical protein
MARCLTTLPFFYMPYETPAGGDGWSRCIISPEEFGRVNVNCRLGRIAGDGEITLTFRFTVKAGITPIHLKDDHAEASVLGGVDDLGFNLDLNPADDQYNAPAYAHPLGFTVTVAP